MVVSSEAFYGIRTNRFKPAGPDVGWSVHNFQDEAFAHLTSNDLFVWSSEIDAQGSRQYIVASISNFWKRYRTLQPEFRHHYEVITAGKPCHLYLDLEYHRETNPAANGEQMMITVREEVTQALTARYGPEIVRGMEWIDMDSSTASKFSRHLVLRLSVAAFESNQHCGKLIHSMCESMEARRATEKTIDALWVWPAPPKRTKGHTDVCVATHESPKQQSRTTFIDLSVYSRNRCFRLFKSSKVGKRAPFLPANMDQATLWQMPYEEVSPLPRLS